MSNLTLKACLCGHSQDMSFADLVAALEPLQLLRLGVYLSNQSKEEIERELSALVEIPLPPRRIQGFGTNAKNTLQLRFNNGKDKPSADEDETRCTG